VKNGKRKNEKMVDFMKRFQYNKIDAIWGAEPGAKVLPAHAK
jgi:hypothetical protein